MSLVNIAVAVSGGGRSLANLIDRERSGSTQYHVACVITSRPDCKGVTIAEEAGLEVFCHKFPIVEDTGLNKDLQAFLQRHDVAWIVLAGFLRPIPVLSPWESRIVNIHPALLPKFGGKGMFGQHVHKAVIAAGETESGATVHFVNEHYDEGAVIAQIKVPVYEDDDETKLASRVFAAECKLYPEVLNQLIQNKLPLRPGKIFSMSATDD